MLPLEASYFEPDARKSGKLENLSVCVCTRLEIWVSEFASEFLSEIWVSEFAYPVPRPAGQPGADTDVLG